MHYLIVILQRQGWLSMSGACGADIAGQTGEGPCSSANCTEQAGPRAGHASIQDSPSLPHQCLGPLLRWGGKRESSAPAPLLGLRGADASPGNWLQATHVHPAGRHPAVPRQHMARRELASTCCKKCSALQGRH